MKLAGWPLLAALSLAATAAGAAPPAAPAAAVETTPAWKALTAAQQAVLAPLQRDWPTIDGQHKEKWLEVASRFKTMPEAERQRVRDRMAEWARLTPNERARARLNFQQTREISPADRQARWEAYQALPEDERKALAQKAKPAAKSTSTAAVADVRASEAAPKRNIVPAPKQAAVKPVTPVVVQAKPGATTSLMSTRNKAPSHQQPGAPKIAAASGRDVDPATLLPQRGPQKAATGAVASPSDPTEHP